MNLISVFLILYYDPKIEHELSHPWLARLDHLEHRMWIEANEANALWEGKVSYNRSVAPLILYDLYHFTQYM